ncbi:MAG: hypothetical protein V1754_06830, partial [Pseudomonadota bacterium]
PDAKERVNIMYRKARVYYENCHFQKASELFADVIAQYPHRELAVYSADLVLECLNQMEQFKELEGWLDNFLANEKLLATGKEVDPEFETRLVKLKGEIERKQVEQLEKNQKWRECGEGYARLANKYQNDPKWAELLFNSAMCYETAKLIGQAIYVRSTLIKAKLDDKDDKNGRLLAQKSLYMIAQNYHALAWYSRAAKYYEDFANKFPGEKESPDALQNAIVFRLGRGEFEKAQKDSDMFLDPRKYGSRKKYQAKAAAVHFSLGYIYEETNDIPAMMKHYENYISRWSKFGGVDQTILAHVKIAEALWNASCPVETVNGACIKVGRVRSKRTVRKIKGEEERKKKTIEIRSQCGPETKMRVEVLKRNPAKVSLAQKHFKAALDLYKKFGDKDVRGANEDERARRTKDMLHAAASAQFHQGEMAFESFLEVKFPEGLDFSEDKKTKDKKKKQSEKEFSKYLDTKGTMLNKTRETYQEVIKLRDAHWAIAASARIGQLFQNFADALYTAPVPKASVPKGLTTRDQKEEYIMAFTDAYCDTLENKAAPLEDKAVQGLDTCLKKSTEYSWYNDWSLLCEKELNQINPKDYPIASEIRPTPGYVVMRAGRASVIDNIK